MATLLDPYVGEKKITAPLLSRDESLTMKYAVHNCRIVVYADLPPVVAVRRLLDLYGPQTILDIEFLVG